MTLRFREAVEADLSSIVALLSDDILGQGREGVDLEDYRKAFRALALEDPQLPYRG